MHASINGGASILLLGDMFYFGKRIKRDTDMGLILFKWKVENVDRSGRWTTT